MKEDGEVKTVVEDVENNVVLPPISNNNEKKKESKWKVVQAATERLVPPRVLSPSQIKINQIIDDLKKFSAEEGKPPKSVPSASRRSPAQYFQFLRQRLNYFLLQRGFHYSIIILVLIDLVVVLVDLVLAQLSSPCFTAAEMSEYNISNQRDTCFLPPSSDLRNGELFLFYFSVCLLLIFVSELVLSFLAFGWRHYLNPLFFLDGLLVFTSFVMELYFHFGNLGRAGRAAAAIVLLRLWKIVRAIHAVAHSITVKNRALIQKIREAQTIIEEEKKCTEKMLDKLEIKVEYFIGLLKELGAKVPASEDIDRHVDKIWQERQTGKE